VPADDQILQYNAGSGIWEYGNLPEIDAAYGVCFREASHTRETLAIPVVGTWVIIDIATIQGPVSEFIQSANGQLQYSGTDNITVKLSSFFDIEISGPAVEDLRFEFSINGARIGQGSSGTTLSNGREPSNMYMQAIVNLAPGDTVEVQAINDTSTRNIEFISFCLMVNTFEGTGGSNPADINIYNTSGVLTSNRVVNANGLDLTILGGDTFIQGNVLDLAPTTLLVNGSSGVQGTLLASNGTTLGQYAPGTPSQILVSDPLQPQGLRWADAVKGQLEVQLNGATVLGSAEIINFTGAGVNVINAGGVAEVQVAGGGSVPDPLTLGQLNVTNISPNVGTLINVDDFTLSGNGPFSAADNTVYGVGSSLATGGTNTRNTVFGANSLTVNNVFDCVYLGSDIDVTGAGTLANIIAIGKNISINANISENSTLNPIMVCANPGNGDIAGTIISSSSLSSYDELVGTMVGTLGDSNTGPGNVRRFASLGTVTTRLRATDFCAMGHSVTVGNLTNQTIEQVCIGLFAQAQDNRTVAIGARANAEEDNCIAIGANSTSSLNGAISLGRLASAGGEGSVAIGLSADASGFRSVALGDGTTANNNRSVAIGGGASANGQCVAINSGAGPNSIVVSSGSWACPNNVEENVLIVAGSSGPGGLQPSFISNCIVGHRVAQNMATGTDNTILGNRILDNTNQPMNRNTLLGSQIFDLGAANTLSINQATCVGNGILQQYAVIDTAIPSSIVAVGHSIGASVTSGFDNVMIGGDVASSIETSVARSVFIGTGSGANAAAALDGIAIGWNARTSGARYETQIGENITTGGFNAILRHRQQIVIQENWINGSVNAVNNDVNGNFVIVPSDERAKTDIETIDDGEDIIKSLRPVRFKWNEHYEKSLGSKTQHGFIAQEVPEAFQQKCGKLEGCDEDGLTLNKEDFIAPLVSCVQKLMKRVDDLESKIRKQNKVINILRKCQNKQS
jgi:hypothetical protein